MNHDVPGAPTDGCFTHELPLHPAIAPANVTDVGMSRVTACPASVTKSPVLIAQPSGDSLTNKLSPISLCPLLVAAYHGASGTKLVLVVSVPCGSARNFQKIGIILQAPVSVALGAWVAAVVLLTPRVTTQEVGLVLVTIRTCSLSN